MTCLAQNWVGAEGDGVNATNDNLLQKIYHLLFVIEFLLSVLY